MLEFTGFLALAASSSSWLGVKEYEDEMTEKHNKYRGSRGQESQSQSHLDYRGELAGGSDMNGVI
jgi:hypothetical protein